MPNKTIPQTHRETMVAIYRNGATAKVAADTFGYSPNACYFALKQAGVPRRSRSEVSRKYAVNEEFFDCIDSEAKAYWLGFLSADGTIGKNFVELALSGKDERHLRKFVDALESGHPVKVYWEGGYQKARVHIGSTRLVDSLKRLGVTQRKSLTLEPCSAISESLLAHYWRGMVDGDGSISYFRRNGKIRGFKINLVGTESMVWAFSDFISSHIKTRARPTRHDSIFAVRYSGISLPQRVALLLYEGATVYLDRKKARAEELLAFPQPFLSGFLPSYEVI